MTHYDPLWSYDSLMTQFDQTQAKPNRNHTQFTTFKLTYFFLFISSDGFIQLSLNLVKVIIIKYIHFTLIISDQKFTLNIFSLFLSQTIFGDILLPSQTRFFYKWSSVTFRFLFKLYCFINDLRWHFVVFSNSIVLQMIFFLQMSWHFVVFPNSFLCCGLLFLQSYFTARIRNLLFLLIQHSNLL